MGKSGSVAKDLSRARHAAKSHDWVEACLLYGRVLEHFPANKRARQGLQALRQPAKAELLSAAETAAKKRAWAEVERTLIAATILVPEAVEVHLSLASCRLETGNAPGALQAANEAFRLDPKSAQALNAKGRALREMGRMREAECALQQALAICAGKTETLNSLGILARGQGQRELAADFFRQAVAEAPSLPTLHHNLSHSVTYTANEPHLKELRDLLAKFAPEDQSAALLHFALFKAFDDLNDRELAFRHLQIGNRLKSAASPYEFKTDATQFAFSKLLFGQSEFAVAATPEPDLTVPRMIFVTGMPRSGTTLIERILARSDETQACGELTVVPRAVGQLLRAIMIRPDKRLIKSDIDELRSRLLDGYSAYSDGRPVMIDKMPLNFRWIGFICAALPEATIVHVSRDSMAVGWSLYKHAFSGAGNAFAYDVNDIARFMVLHQQVMEHWREVCTGRIFELFYEDLVCDPDEITRQLAEAAGLPWTKDWLSPEEATSQVFTASADQSRRPIYRDSNDGWKRYRQHLMPLVEALTSAGQI